MESTYLKESLAKLGRLHESIGASADAGNWPSVLGRLEGAVKHALDWNLPEAQRSAERLEIIDREHERLVTIFEAIGIDLDEETMATLELIGRDQDYKDQRRSVRVAITQICADVQADEREIEHDQATDALAAAGFVYDESNDNFTRGTETVLITLANGRECRYNWAYEMQDVRPGQLRIIDSGASGDFSRLIALIAPKVQG